MCKLGIQCSLWLLWNFVQFWSYATYKVKANAELGLWNRIAWCQHLNLLLNFSKMSIYQNITDFIQPMWHLWLSVDKGTKKRSIRNTKLKIIFSQILPHISAFHNSQFSNVKILMVTNKGVWVFFLSIFSFFFPVIFY